ncbi:MAG: response regulator [Dechloromonas sp.]|nr:MAG: response regulator [Dechloromonas sp.]
MIPARALLYGQCRRPSRMDSGTDHPSPVMPERRINLRRAFLAVSAALVGMLLLIVVVTLAALSAFNTATDAGRHRQNSLALIHAVQHEVGLLGRLVASYVSTADPRFLIYYYDVLAIREGVKPRPADLPASFWEQVIAGNREYVAPVGGKPQPLTGLAGQLGFDAGEQAVVRRIMQISERMKETEQIAFAATQGLYDQESGEFVSEAEPQREFAARLLHRPAYLKLRADLAVAVEELASLVDQRTANDLESASARLRDWIFGELLLVLLTGGVLLASYRYLERHLLDPLTTLHAAAMALAGKSFGQRIGDVHGVEEVQSLATTLDGMAASIETELRQREAAQDELSEARARAEVATEAKSIFLANMSHEIRTPMNAILGMAYLAMKSGLPPRQQEYVAKIHAAARSLLGIINDILDFSKIEAGKVELEKAPFDLEPVIQNAMFMVQQRAAGKGVELILDYRLPGSLPALLGDPLRLGQILINLLTNAVKFTEHGHVRLTVSELERSPASATLSFAIEDTGIGISPELLGKLFQEFTQADGATTRKYGGTGLGLSISKRLVEAMGGQIGVESVAGRGSVFHFQIALPLTASGNSLMPELPCICGRALIVDDYAPTCISLAGMLRAAGCCQVDLAASGDEALVRLQAAQASDRPYDLLLVDWDMPGLAGAPLLAAARARELNLPAHILAMSVADAALLRAEADCPEVVERAQKPLMPGVLKRICACLPEPAGKESPAMANGLSRDLGGVRILLVEDHEMNRQVASEMLVGWGAAVDVAGDGLAALEVLMAAPADRYALVLMDLEMPIMDGREAVRRLRADRRFAGLPIIIMTAHAQGVELQQVLAQGGSGYIAKPFEPDELLATVIRYAGLGGTEVAAQSAEAVQTAEEQAFLAALASIPQIDMAVLQRRFAGRTRFLAETLQRFAEDARLLPLRLREALEQGDLDAARRDAHSFKGLAGTFALAELQEALRQLELAIVPGSTPGAPLAEAERCLEAVVEALSRLPSLDVATAELPCPGEADEIVAVLRRHLRDGDGEVEELWRSCRTHLASRYSPRQLATIDHAIVHWDVDGALLALAEPATQEENA